MRVDELIFSQRECPKCGKHVTVTRKGREEAERLARIVEIGGEKEIKPANRRKAALWL